MILGTATINLEIGAREYLDASLFISLIGCSHRFNDELMDSYFGLIDDLVSNPNSSLIGI